MERVMAWGARRASRSLAAAVDWIHLHGIWDPIIRQVALAAHELDTPYAIVPHGMLDPWSLSQQAAKKSLALRLGYRTMINRAQFLHMLNTEEAALLKGLALQTPNIVIPNGVFTQEFDSLPSPDLFRNAYPALGTKPYVLFLSRLHYKKGLDYMCDAFIALRQRLPDIQLVIAGPDYGAKDQAQQQLIDGGVAAHAHLIGPVFGPLKLSALAGAACFCLPSRQEGFSMAILEAMAVGVPVVISEGCHFPEVAQAGAGIITPLDAEKIADALEHVLTDAPRAAAMGTAGRMLVQSHYTWPKIAEQTLAAYQSLRT
jgi:glycosyltransferase involved in cell wall biosynthesis